MCKVSTLQARRLWQPPECKVSLSTPGQYQGKASNPMGIRWKCKAWSVSAEPDALPSHIPGAVTFWLASVVQKLHWPKTGSSCLEHTHLR